MIECVIFYFYSNQTRFISNALINVNDLMRFNRWIMKNTNNNKWSILQAHEWLRITFCCFPISSRSFLPCWPLICWPDISIQQTVRREYHAPVATVNYLNGTSPYLWPTDQIEYICVLGIGCCCFYRWLNILLTQIICSVIYVCTGNAD